ncbi:hypothetical protein F7725_008680 [Dissostichus mawsoni]|uniref:D-aminoacyl-tRNA deacylase n=1 Tax=Dissostichus mawsoni TaxID=36200 RepID=A0A7J5YAD0_DISMA|nr:hypothetical protein F7725_008680 [Dissostichus mawsoni]
MADMKIHQLFHKVCLHGESLIGHFSGCLRGGTLYNVNPNNSAAKKFNFLAEYPSCSCITRRAMEDPFENDQIEQFKVELQTNGPAAAAAKIGAYLEEQDKIPLNIGITGESGSGKSTFVNAFRGLDKKDKSAAAAPTGCTETTKEVKPYPHPQYPNVTLWDLPGVQFVRFDFFIIISATRFTENDVKLAKEIQKMEKKFYFVRSKIDQDMRNEEETQSEFNAEKLITKIRDNCFKVFLVSSHHFHLYDFCLLQETLERELPAHKRAALLLALPIVNFEIIKKKKEALQSKIKFLAASSAVGAAVPVPGLSCALDLAMLVTTAIKYKNTFGLDRKSLQSLADSTRVPLEDLIAEMKSPLALKEISREVILNMLHVSWIHVTLIAEEGFRFIPLFGLPAAAALSFASTYRALSTFLNMLAEDAQRVFTKSLGLHTSSDSGKMVSVLDLPGSVLIVPQATLGGKVKGRAMQYHNNIGKEDAKRLYNAFVSLCEKEVTSEEVTVKHGTYGNRQVLNMDTNGPYTHLMEF